MNSDFRQKLCFLCKLFSVTLHLNCAQQNYRKDQSLTLPMSSLSNTGCLGRVGGEGIRVLSSGNSGSWVTRPGEEGEHWINELPNIFTYITSIILTHPVFSASGRLHWSWLRLGKPPSSCTTSLRSSASPSQAQCHPCTGNKRWLKRESSTCFICIKYKPIWRLLTFGDTTLISSFKNLYFPTSLWNLLPQFFIDRKSVV